MRIVAVTLSPAWDVTLTLDAPPTEGGVCRVVAERREPGGKGVNVARTLAALGVEAVSLTPEGVPVRENLTLRCGAGTWKLNRPAPRLDAAALDALQRQLRDRMCPGDVAVFGGRLPAGVDAARLAELARTAADAGGRVALDADGLTPDDVAAIQPWLMKPNGDELRRLVPFEGDGLREVAQAARTLCRMGRVERVLVSLGARGLLEATAAAALPRHHAQPPAVAVASTVGAGDAALAGYLAAYTRGEDAAACLRFAAACGTACAMGESAWLDAAGAARAAELARQVRIATL